MKKTAVNGYIQLTPKEYDKLLKKSEAPATMPNGTLISQVMLSAQALGAYSSYLPIKPELKNGIIDDEVLGIDWAIETLDETRKAWAQTIDNINSLRDLALLKWIGSISPNEDTIEWVTDKVRNFAQWYDNVNIFSEWYIKTYAPAYTSMQLSVIQKHLWELIEGKDIIIGEYEKDLMSFENFMQGLFLNKFYSTKKGTLNISKDIISQVDDYLRVQNNTSLELRAEIDVLADFIMKEMPDKIINEGACKTAIQIIESQQFELDNIGRYLLSLMTADDLHYYDPKKDQLITFIKLFINRDREKIKELEAHIQLKDGALNDAMQQFKEARHKADDNAALLAQAGERMAILNPNPGNFDQLLKVALAYVTTNPSLLTIPQSNLIKVIATISS